jgi:hypothetical protein
MEKKRPKKVVEGNKSESLANLATVAEEAAGPNVYVMLELSWFGQSRDSS